MYIGKCNIDLIGHAIFEKTYDLKKDAIFIAKDGVLHNDIKAKNVSILKIITSKPDTELEEYLVFENEENKKWIDIELNGENVKSYEKLKEENEKLKEELEEKKDNTDNTVPEEKKGKEKKGK